MKQNKILTVDLGGTNIRVGIVENGVVIEKYQEKLQFKNDLEQSLNQFKTVVSKLMLLTSKRELSTMWPIFPRGLKFL